MSKVYAIKYADGTHEISFDPWHITETKVKGVKGVLYKGFHELKEAENWLKNQRIINQDIDNKGIKIYVDGSFMNSCKYAGWAYVVIEDDNIIAEKYGVTPWEAKSRNIDGEVYAAGQAITWLHENNKKGQLIHDYQGISAWLTGDWSYTSDIASWYVRGYKHHSHLITFVKIKGHKDNKWNDYVDEKAKLGILEYQRKT